MKGMRFMNNTVYNVLKDMSFEDVVLTILNHNHFEVGSKDDRDIYYTAKELIELYPNIFSKYKLDKYIKEENLPFIKDGKERFFLKSNIEKWLEDKNTRAMFKGI